MWVHDNVLEHVSEWTLNFGIYIIFLILQMRKDFDPKTVSLPVREVELNNTNSLNVMSLSQSGLTVAVDSYNIAYVLDAEFKVLSMFSVATDLDDCYITEMCQDYCGTIYVVAMIIDFGEKPVCCIRRFNQNGKKLSEVILPPAFQEKNHLFLSTICTGPGNKIYYKISSFIEEEKMGTFICSVDCKSNSSTIIMEEMACYWDSDGLPYEALNGIMCHSDGNIYTPKDTGISIFNGKGEKLRDIATQEMDFPIADYDDDYSTSDLHEKGSYILRGSLNGYLFLSKVRTSLIKILSLEGTLLGTIKLEGAETNCNSCIIGMDVTSDGYLQVCRLIDDGVNKVYFY